MGKEGDTYRGGGACLKTGGEKRDTGGPGEPVQQHRNISAMDLQNNAQAESDQEFFYPYVPTDILCKQTEQEKLSGVVKSVHRKLRRKYIEGMLVSQLASASILSFDVWLSYQTRRAS